MLLLQRLASKKICNTDAEGQIPSSYRLVAEIFDNDQKKVAFMYLTVVSSLANSCGELYLKPTSTAHPV